MADAPCHHGQPDHQPGRGGPGEIAFSQEQIRALSAMRAGSRPVRRAAAVASISGWSLAVFACLTLLGGLFGSVASILLGAGLGVAAYNELRGANQLRRFEARGARLLGFNQIGLGALLVLYSGWSLWSSLGGSGLAAVGGSTGDADMDAMVQGLWRTVHIGVYGTLAAAGVIVPGLTAWYYFSRGRLVRAFVRRVPGGTLDALRAAA